MLAQPTSNIPLPEEVQNALESARANVSILESKATVLQSANFAMQKDNAKLVKEQEYLQNEIETLTNQVNNLTNSIAEKQAEQADLEASIQKITKDLNDSDTKLKEEWVKYNAGLADLKVAQEKFKEDRDQLDFEVSTFRKTAENFATKVSKLKDVINNF